MKKKKRKRIREKIGIIILTSVIIFFTAIFIMPIVFTLCNSFMGSTEISANYGMIFATTDTGAKKFIADTVNLKFIPDRVSFSQYISVLFKSPDYLLKFWNSVIYVVPIVVFQIIVACLAAYGFSRYKGRAREIIFFTYIILMLMPYQVTLVPNFMVNKWLNLLDSHWAIWLPGIFSPYAVFLLTKYMRRIPISLLEAAKIDGAGEWEIFTKVAIPLCKGALGSVAILIFIDYTSLNVCLCDFCIIGHKRQIIKSCLPTIQSCIIYLPQFTATNNKY